MPNKSTSKSIDNPIISETLSIDSTGTFTNYAAGSLSHDLQFKGTGTLILDIGCVGLYAI